MSSNILSETLKGLLRDAVKSTEGPAASTNEILVRSVGNASASDTENAAGAYSGASAPWSGRAAWEAEGRLSRELAALTEAARLQAETIDANTRAVVENSLNLVNKSGGSTAASVGKSIGSFLGGGFGLVKLIGGLLGGDKSTETISAASFSLPPAVNYEAGLSGAGGVVSAVRHDQDGMPRATNTPVVGQTNVTVQVDAMDSRSFMDRSEEIALAVKRALLDSHSLGDVVAEL